MGLQHCTLNLSTTNQELCPHGTLDFRCAGYDAHYTNQPQDAIPWHWHPEIEILYLQEGALKLQIPAKTLLLTAGDCVVINANMLHAATANPLCQLHSIVFSPLLITGTHASIFATRYLTPLLQCPAFDGFLVLDSGAKTNFCAAFEALSHGLPGYEFLVRDGLTALCFSLWICFESEIKTGSAPLNQDSLRIQKMLECIHTNYAEPLTLGQIANAAEVGERECLRCFQRAIQISPMQYLLKYRVMKGAAKLRANPSESISALAIDCGFDSASYFSQVFKRFYGCTPRAYRA